jgi:hypothetical protein
MKMEEKKVVIDDFHKRMEAMIVPLIELSGDIIRQNDKHRRRLEVSADEQRSRLQADYETRSQALQAEYVAKLGEIKLREDALEERKKALDDRDSTHGEPFQPEPDEVVEALAIARGLFEAAVSRLPFDARR